MQEKNLQQELIRLKEQNEKIEKNEKKNIIIG